MFWVCIPSYHHVDASHFRISVLQYHYNILAALALQEDTPSPDDTTLPDNPAIIARAGPILKSIKETLNTDERYEKLPWRRSTTAAVIDRPAGGSRAGTAGLGDDDDEDRKPKKVKVSKEKASISVKELEKLLAAAFKGGESKLKKVCLAFVASSDLRIYTD